MILHKTYGKVGKGPELSQIEINLRGDAVTVDKIYRAIDVLLYGEDWIEVL